MHCDDVSCVPGVWWFVLGGSTFAGAKSKGHKGGVCWEDSLLPASETDKETSHQQQQDLPPFSQVRADITHKHTHTHTSVSLITLFLFAWIIIH